jgi:hypothetical protein
MRTILTQSSLGLALALSGAAIARPVDTSAFLEHTSFANEQMPIHYRHKRCYPDDRCYRADRLHDRLYRHKQPHSQGTDRPQTPNDSPTVGTGRPEAGKSVRPEPPVWREPTVRERLQAL